jgi:hypothetical protein
VFASQVKRASSIQVRAPPPVQTLSAAGPCGYQEVLTVVGAGRYAATSRSVDIADVLLEARIWGAAGAVGNRSAGVLWAGSSNCECGDGEEKGNGELHICGGGCWGLLKRRVSCGVLTINRAGGGRSEDDVIIGMRSEG